MEYWIWLRQIKGLGPVIEKRLLNRFETPRLIYQACEDELMSVTGVGKVLVQNIASARSLDNAYRMLEEIYKKNIKLLTYNQPLYPSLAKDYNEAPTLLYYKGNIRTNIEGVAIVGSRRCSEYGKQIAVTAAEFLAHNDIPVISGMAKGIDGYSHISCLKNDGYTIAFLGNGVDICYPNEHVELMEAIIENGAVISEYPPGTRPRAEFFPRRNALISSWSKKILVVEAAENSGALITAKLGKLQGREVFVPPHEIYNITGKGSNKLISEGANIYLSPSQLLIKNESYSSKDKNLIESAIPESGGNSQEISQKRELIPIEEKILFSITDAAKTIEEIARETDIDQVELIEHISVMDLEGIIRAVAGGKYLGNSSSYGFKSFSTLH